MNNVMLANKSRFFDDELLFALDALGTFQLVPKTTLSVDSQQTANSTTCLLSAYQSQI